LKTKLVRMDPWLRPYLPVLQGRAERAEKMTRELSGSGTLSDFADGAERFGLHREGNALVYREWAPGADELHVTGDFNGWDRLSHPMKKLEDGVFEIVFRGKQVPANGQRFLVLVTRNGETFERIPAYAHYVVQDPETTAWCMEVHLPEAFPWTDERFTARSRKRPFSGAAFIYECHIGMAQEEQKIGTYTEFRDHILPRVKKAGYNTIQLMAIQEHPYYGSFGYQVSSFFAVSSRFGTPEELKSLIDTAHSMKIRVLLDLVHSHGVKNTREGLSEFDGTPYQYFHAGARGEHPAWGTRLFDYGKREVIRFLLSNLKYFLEEYHFDGFRFDGVTSMLYRDHGLGESFDSYGKYFSDNTDEDAVTYLTLANALIKEVAPYAVTVAEDMSGMPGMCIPVKDGGIGFDYRLAMGEPDLWIRTLRERTDGSWDLEGIYYELTRRRPREKVIGYAESHDQALVGDKTLMFRLCDRAMYDHMSVFSPEDPVIDRGMALHKMIRLLTFSLGGDGYLNFCGNEFGHPEWIDFPREGNNWSYFYCRRQWSLTDDPDLKYHFLGDFDRAMLELGRSGRFLSETPQMLYVHEEDQILVFRKGEYLFAFNFHPERSFPGYVIPAGAPGEYGVILNTDEPGFLGGGRVDPAVSYRTDEIRKDCFGFPVYLPCRTGIVFRRMDQ